jgi:hypothetical protein
MWLSLWKSAFLSGKRDGYCGVRVRCLAPPLSIHNDRPEEFQRGQIHCWSWHNSGIICLQLLVKLGNKYLYFLTHCTLGILTIMLTSQDYYGDWMRSFMPLEQSGDCAQHWGTGGEVSAQLNRFRFLKKHQGLADQSSSGLLSSTGL